MAAEIKNSENGYQNVFYSDKGDRPGIDGVVAGANNPADQAQYFGLVLENSHNILFLLDKEGVIRFCSKKTVEKAALKSRAEAEGRHFTDFYRRFTNDKFIEGARQVFQTIRETKETLETELELDFSGMGNPRIYVVQSVPLIDENGSFEGAQIVFFDSEDRITTAADRQTRIMLNSMPFACTLRDENRNIIDCNDATLRMFNVKNKSDLTSKANGGLLAFTPEFQPDGCPSAEKIKELDRMMRENDRAQCEWMYVTSDGEPLPVEMISVKVPWLGGFRFAIYSRDLRAIVKAKERSKTLEQEKRMAQAASEAKSDFLASTSHEIRTPMNAIIGMSDLIRTDNLDEQQRGYIEDIRSTSRVLLQLINDILDISKIEAGAFDISPVDYNIRKMFDNICSMMSVDMKNKSLSFENSISDDVPEMLYGDEIRVRQIIFNILNNSVKYTIEGSVGFHISRAVWKERDCLRIVISDTGIGIREEDLPKLFDKFTQFDLRKNRGVVGTGLGLRITKQLVGKMDGDILVESKYGKGTTFTVYLPLALGDPAKEKQADIFLGFKASPDTKILVVDDNAINLTVATGYLLRYGIAADTADGGESAVRRVQEKPYDMVLMDHMMPDVDGIEATKRIRALGGKYEKLPVIALSANALSGMKQNFIGAGMNDFIAKPIDPPELNAALRKWLPVEKIQNVYDEEKSAENEVLPLKEPTLDYPRVTLDAKSGIRNFKSDERLYGKNLSDFAAVHRDDPKTVTAMLKAGNVQGARRFVHTLKNRAALIGAFSLARAARAAETALINDGASGNKELYDMKAELSNVLKEALLYEKD